jgi:GntR family galactonate operon transcriptional repressor
MRQAIGPLRRERLHDQITRHIALGILRGDLGKGASGASTETDLGRELQVSRTAMREAVKVLAAKGLLEVRPGRGMRVCPRSEWNLLDPDLLSWQCEAVADVRFVRDLYQVRLIIEPATAEIAAASADDNDVSAICHWYHEMATQVEDSEMFISADMEFHAAVSKACHNDFLIQLNTLVGAALRSLQYVSRQLRGGSKNALRLHKAVAEAIRKHDGPEARKATQGLVKQAAQDIHRVLNLDGPNSP